MKITDLSTATALAESIRVNQKLIAQIKSGAIAQFKIGDMEVQLTASALTILYNAMISEAEVKITAAQERLSGMGVE